VFTDTGTGTSGVTLGTDSTVVDYVDLYGTYVKRTTTGQDTLKVYYPDDQVVANIAVLGEGATISTTGGAAGATVKQAVPVKTPLGKLDTEITSSDKSTKNLILVGGPAVNTLVKELADGGKTKTRDWYVSQGAGTAIIDLVEDAFTSGKSALVVAGHSAADTRVAAGIVQTYDTHATDFAGKTTVVIKNGVISTTAA
jgi:S-layer protein (TIGR01564 family)